MAKESKEAANYRPADGAERCSGCANYKGGSCSVVSGSIDPDDTCDMYAQKPMMRPPGRK